MSNKLFPDFAADAVLPTGSDTSIQDNQDASPEVRITTMPQDEDSVREWASDRGLRLPNNSLLTALALSDARRNRMTTSMTHRRADATVPIYSPERRRMSLGDILDEAVRIVDEGLDSYVQHCPPVRRHRRGPDHTTSQ